MLKQCVRGGEVVLYWRPTGIGKVGRSGVVVKVWTLAGCVRILESVFVCVFLW